MGDHAIHVKVYVMQTLQWVWFGLYDFTVQSFQFWINWRNNFVNRNLLALLGITSALFYKTSLILLQHDSQTTFKISVTKFIFVNKEPASLQRFLTTAHGNKEDNFGNDQWASRRSLNFLALH